MKITVLKTSSLITGMILFFLISFPSSTLFAQTHILESVLTENWRNNAWENWGRDLYTCDSLNRPTRIEQQYWDGGQQKWMPSGQQLYTYNPQGLASEILYQMWDSQSGKYVNTKQVLMVYDAQGNEVDWRDNGWDFNQSQWNNRYKHTKSYNSQGQITRQIDEDWRNNQWNFSRHREYTYSSSGELKEYLLQHWGGSNGWYDVLDHFYTYDSTGKVAQEIVEGNSGGFWGERLKTAFSYDSITGFIQQSEKQGKEPIDTIWNDFERNTYTYHPFNKLHQRVYERADMNQTRTYENFRRYTYLYKQGSSLAIDELPDVPKIHLFPNPAKQSITIMAQDYLGNSFSIINYTGKVILQGVFQELGTTIDIEGLKSGYYVLIPEKNPEQAIRFIKE